MQTRCAALFALVFVAALACSEKGGPPPPKDVLQEALAKPNVVILDVRTPGEFKGGHVPGAVNLPMDKLSTVGEVVADKSQPVVVHCAKGVRSARAAKTLADMGYTNITDAKTPEAVAAAKGVALQTE